MIFRKWGGGQRPFGTFPKIHQFWRRHPSLTLSVAMAMTYLGGKSTLNVILIFCICLKIKPARITVCVLAHIKLCNQGARRCHWGGSTRSPGACKEHHQGGSVHQVILIFKPSTFLIWQICLVSMRSLCNIVSFYNVLMFGNNVIWSQNIVVMPSR